MSEDDARGNRKLAAKRLNENLKLLANSVNAVALATLGAAFLLPSIAGASPASGIWILIALGLHLLAQAILHLLRIED